MYRLFPLLAWLENFMTRTSFKRVGMGFFATLLCVLGCVADLRAGVVYDNDTGRLGGIFNAGVEYGDEVVLSSVTPSQSRPVLITGAYVVVAPNGYTGGASVTLRIRKLNGPPDPGDLGNRPGPGDELSSGSAPVPLITRTSRIYVPLSATLNSPDFVVTAQFSGLSGSTVLGVMVADGPSGGSSSASEFWVKSEGGWKVQALEGSPANFGFILLAQDGPEVLRVGGGTALSIVNSVAYRENAAAVPLAKGSLVSFSGVKELTVAAANLSGDKLTSGGLTSNADGLLKFAGTQEGFREFLEGLQYENTSDNPRDGAHVIHFTAGNLSSSMTVNVTVVNDFPQVTLDLARGAQATYTVNQFTTGQDSIVIPFSFSDPEGTALLTLAGVSDNEEVIKNSDLEMVEIVVDAAGNGTGQLKIKQANVPTGTVYPAGLKVAILATDKDRIPGKGSVIINVIVRAVIVNRAPDFAIAGNGSSKIWAVDEDGVLEVAFTLADDAPEGLVIEKSSSNPSMISAEAVVPKSRAAGPSPYFEIKPQPDQNGEVTVTLVAKDKDGATATQVLSIKVNATPDAPVITAATTAFTGTEFQPLTENELPASSLILRIPFEVGDVDAQDSVTLSVELDDVAQRLLSDAQILAVSKVLQLTPRPFRSGGPAKITLVATDKFKLIARKEFTLTIPDRNNPPFFDAVEIIGGRNAVRFKLIDEETLTATNLFASSDRLDLVPNDFVFGKEGDFWVLTYKIITPKESGKATLTLTVKDSGDASSTGKISVDVTKIKTAPILVLAARAGAESGSTTEITFGVDDVGTLAKNLIISAEVISGQGIANSNIPVKILDSTGKERGLTVALLPGQSGDVQIKVTVSDEDGDSTSGILKLRVNADPVLILPKEGTVIVGKKYEFEFEISDDLTDLSALEFSVKTSGLALAAPLTIPVGVEGSGGKKFRQSIQAGTIAGLITVEITLQDTDGGGALGGFQLRVIEDIKAPPVVLNIPAQEVIEDFGLHRIDLEISDTDTPAASLKVEITPPVPTFLGATIVAATRGDGKVLLLTSKADQSGEGVINFTVSDGTTVVSKSVTVRVTSVNDAPVITAMTGVPASVAGVRELVLQQSRTDVTPSATVVFTVTDADVGDTVTLTFTTSDTTLLPRASLVLGADRRSLTLTPARGQTGEVRVTVIATDKANEIATETFLVRVRSAENTVPTITAITGLPTGLAGARELVLTQNEGGVAPTATLVFVVTDVDVGERVALSFVSSDLKLLPQSGLVLGADERTLTLTPAVGQLGVSRVTVTATDSLGAKANDTFFVRVKPSVNTPPTLAGLRDRVMLEDGNVTIAFDVEDKGTQASELRVAAVSDNETLVPAKELASAVLNSGSAGRRSFVLAPAANQFGEANITLKVSDPQGLFTEGLFKLIVQAVNDKPTISNIPDQALEENGSKDGISLVIADVEDDTPPLRQLKVSVKSSKQILLPDPTGAASDAIVLSGSGGTRLLKLTPVKGQFGDATVEVTVKDSGGSEASTTFSVKVKAAANTAPTISSLSSGSVDVDEDNTFGPVSFAVGDRESLKDLRFEVSSSEPALVPGNPTAIVIESVLGDLSKRRLSVHPALNQTGTARITILVRDPEGASNEAHFDLVVKPVNDAPAIQGIPSQSLLEDGSVEGIDVVLSDVDSPLESLKLEAKSSDTELLPSKSILFSGTGGRRKLGFTLAPGKSGNFIVTLTARDSSGGVGSTQFGVSVKAAVNQPPTITDLVAAVTIDEDSSSGQIPFKIGDPDRGADPFAVVVSATSSNTRVIPNLSMQIGGGSQNRFLQFTPAKDQSSESPITITLKATDPRGAFDTKTLLVTVRAVNDAPTIRAIDDVVTDQGKAVEGIDVLVNDIDNPLSELEVSVVTSSDETLLSKSGISISPGTDGKLRMSLVPAAGKSGVSQVTLKVVDKGTPPRESTTQFKVTVKPLVNNPPTLAVIGDVSFDEDPPSPVEVLIPARDLETPTRDLDIEVISSDEKLLPRGGLFLSPDKTKLFLRPVANAFGTATVTVTVTDSSKGKISGEFKVTVRPVNDAPSFGLEQDSFFMAENTSKTVPFRVFDPDTALSKLKITAISSDPQLFSPNGLKVEGGAGEQSTRYITLQPELNKGGSATIKVTATDDGGASTSIEFNVTVNHINNLPVIVGLQDIEIEQGRTSTPMTFTVTDAETAADALTFEVFSGNAKLIPPSNVLVTRVGSTWTITVKPSSDQLGVGPVTIQVSDKNGGRTDLTFLVLVKAQNNPPTISAPVGWKMDEDIPTTLFTANAVGTSPVFVIDDDFTPIGSLVLTAISSNPVLFPSIDIKPVPGRGDARQLSLAPAADQFGETVITITATDSGGLQGMAKITVTVRSKNDRPTLGAIGAQSGFENRSIGPIPLSYGDIETPKSQLELLVSSNNRRLFPPGSSSLEAGGLVLRPSSFGTAIVTLTVTDTDGGQAKVDFPVTVSHVNAAPSIAAVGTQTFPEDSSVQIPVEVSDSDTDLALVNVAVEATSSNPSLFGPGGLLIEGTGARRTLIIKPNPDQNGSAVLVLTARDNDGAVSREVGFQVNVTAVNDLPEVGNIGSQVVIVDGASTTVTFSATDKDSSLAPERFTFSDYTGLVMTSVTGNGSTWFFTIFADSTVASGRMVQMIVNDRQGGVVTRSFEVSVFANTPPILEFGNAGPISVSLDAAQGLQTVQQVILIEDEETHSEKLSLDIQSSNVNVLPKSRVELSGNGGRRILKLSPVTAGVQENATVEVTVTVTDEGALPDGSSLVTKKSVSKKFLVKFVVNQHAPTISMDVPSGGGANLVTAEDTSSSTRGFTVGDQDGPDIASLKVTYSVSDTALIGSVNLAGQGLNRTVQVVPAKDANGTATVTLFVSDPSGLVASTSFNVTVTPVNDFPTIDTIPDPGEINENAGVQTVSITGISAGPSDETELVKGVTAVLDPQAGENLQLLQDLVMSYAPNAKVAALSYKPGAGQNGVLTVAVTATDGAAPNKSLTQRFRVRVRAVNDAPVIEFDNDGNRSPLAVVEGKSSVARSFKISDPETPPSGLKVSVRSRSPALFADSDIVIGGVVGASQRTVAVKSGEGKTGQGQIELSVGDGETTTVVFIDVIVTHRPEIVLAGGLSKAGSLTVFLGEESEAVLFDVADVETPLAGLTFSSVVGNVDLFQVSSVSVVEGKLRVHIAPLLANFDAPVTITVTDVDGGSDSFTFRVFVKPQIVPLTASVSASPGLIVGTQTKVTLTANVTGTGELRFQWKKGSDVLTGATSSSYVIISTVSEDAGGYTLLVQDELGTSSATVQLTVLAPPKIVQDPQANTTVAEGGTFVLDVQTDVGDYEYEWRKGGVRVLGQTGSSFIRERATSEDGGLYQVVVKRRNSADSVSSRLVRVEVIGDSLAMSDAFESAPLLELKKSVVIANKLSQSGTVTAINTTASRQIGEPQIAGRIGRKSVWAKWTAPKNGTMKLNTTGSDFDTLLGVYRAASSPPKVGQLELVASDDDSGGSFTSKLEFNAKKDQEYFVVVDGRAGDEGIIKLNSRFQETFILSPDIISEVVDISAAEGAEVIFSVVAKNVFTYQWFFNGVKQQSETGPEYRISKANDSHVGEYEVVVSNGRFENDKSSTARLVLTTNPGEFPVDKPGDNATVANTSTSQALASRHRLFKPVSAAAASGFRGTQVFNTYGSTTELGEPDLCGIIGGASQWSSYVAPSDGLLRVSTEGSDFDTLLGVFTGPADQGFEALTLLGCDNNSGADGKTSVVTVPVKAGISYYFAVDGPNGQTGIVGLNYALVLPDVAIRLPPPAPDKGLMRLEVPGVLGAKYVLQTSVNLISWRTVLVTTAVTNPLEFRDEESGTAPVRFYRLIKQ